MSKPDATPKLDLDLESAFLPAWAQKSSEENPYAKFEGRDRDFDSGGRRGRQRRDDGGRSPRRHDKGGSQGRDRRNDGPRRPEGDRQGQRAGGPNPGGDRGQQRGRPTGAKGDGRGFKGKGGQRRDRPPRKTRQEILAALPQLKAQIIPEAKGVALLAKRIRLQGRAYPLFDIAGLILQSPERYHIRFTTQTAQKDQPQQNIWLCKVDHTVWLDETEAIQYILQKYLDHYYTSERTEAEPPKGAFNFVAQCGISGIVLGPPNYHGYQAKLREIHGERFARMDFEHWKSKVKIVHDEEVVKKWLEEQSWTTEYADKNNAESDKLHSLDEVEIHFRQHHLAEALECVHSAQISGEVQKQVSRPIRDLMRFHVEDQKRFPLQLATELSQQFTRQGLQFFKVNKTVTHVSVSRPHYLDLDATPVSETVKKIVEFIDATPDCTRSKVMDALAPVPEVVIDTPPASDPEESKNDAPQAADASAPSEKVSEASSESSEGTESKQAEPEVKAAESPKAEAVLTPQQSAVSTDLHWLIHQGHVIEFSNGKMETAKKPKVQPPKKQNKKALEKVNEPENAVSTEPKAEPDAAPSEASPVVEASSVTSPTEQVAAVEASAPSATETSQTPETVSTPTAGEPSEEETKTTTTAPESAADKAEQATPDPSNDPEPEAPASEVKPSNS